jgi:hypothetical protein
MKKKHRYRYPQFVVDAVANLAEEVSEYLGNLSVFSELKLNEQGQTFRAAPYFQGKPWYNWAMSGVGEQIEGFEHCVVPVHIRCFVDLTFLPAENPTKYVPGLYMIAKPTCWWMLLHLDCPVSQ